MIGFHSFYPNIKFYNFHPKIKYYFYPKIEFYIANPRMGLFDNKTVKDNPTVIMER